MGTPEILTNLGFLSPRRPPVTRLWAPNSAKKCKFLVELGRPRLLTPNTPLDTHTPPSKSIIKDSFVVDVYQGWQKNRNPNKPNLGLSGPPPYKRNLGLSGPPPYKPGVKKKHLGLSAPPPIDGVECPPPLVNEKRWG